MFLKSLQVLAIAAMMLFSSSGETLGLPVKEDVPRGDDAVDVDADDGAEVEAEADAAAGDCPDMGTLGLLLV